LHINRNPTPRELAVFGVSLPVSATVLGLIIAHRTGSMTPAVVIWAIGAALALSYLSVPGVRRPLFVLFNHIGYPIAWFVAHVVVTFIFFVVVTPVGLLMRVLGHDPLERTFDQSASTYWVPHAPPGDVHRSFKQF